MASPNEGQSLDSGDTPNRGEPGPATGIRCDCVNKASEKVSELHHLGASYGRRSFHKAAMGESSMH